MSDFQALLLSCVILTARHAFLPTRNKPIKNVCVPGGYRVKRVKQNGLKRFSLNYDYYQK